MTDIINTIILGIIQGIAEFLPISSSAHLIIFRDLFGIGADMSTKVALCFDLALHLGTLLAIAVFFFKDFLNMVIKGFTKGVKDKDGKLFFQIVVATIPAAIVGVLFEETIENAKKTEGELKLSLLPELTEELSYGSKARFVFLLQMLDIL